MNCAVSNDLDPPSTSFQPFCLTAQCAATAKINKVKDAHHHIIGEIKIYIKIVENRDFSYPPVFSAPVRWGRRALVVIVDKKSNHYVVRF